MNLVSINTNQANTKKFNGIVQTEVLNGSSRKRILFTKYGYHKKRKTTMGDLVSNGLLRLHLSELD
jgi:hypothetical protein